MTPETAQNLQDNQNSLTSIPARLATPSPPFFKKITNILLTLGAIGGAIVAIPTSLVAVPAIITSIAGYCIAVGGIGAALAKLTVNWNTVQNNINSQPKP